ncbi:DUF5723 family protein [Lentimicrobium sp.]
MLYVLLIVVGTFAQAQDFLPFSISNYSGVSGVHLQPASIADSRYKFDVVLTGFSAQAANNYLAMKREAIFRPGSWNDVNFGTDNIYRTLNGKDKQGMLSTVVMLPSFMVNLTPQHALSFSSRIRGQVNIDRLSEDLAEVMAESFDNPDFYQIILNNSNLSAQTNWWAEFNFTYAQEIPLPSDKHFLKGGITLKYLQGIASGYSYIRDLSFRLEEKDVISIFKSDVNYGISGNLNSKTFQPFDFVSDPGFGLDLGFVYEYRPDIDDYRYTMDGKQGLLRPDKNKYLLRVGISLLDLGGINFKKDFHSQDFTADIRNWDLTQVQINSIEDFNDTLRNRFNFGQTVEESFRMRLPTALSLQVDYNLGRGFYLNMSPYLAMRKGTETTSKTHYFTTVSVIPRYEMKWFGAGLPMQIDENGKAQAGVALRLGPVWVGSNSILSNVIGSKSYNADVYVMLKVPIFRHLPRDRDGDGVSDKLDKCPDTPGTWEQQGCADRDGDGVPDAQDECPDVPGLAKYNGCPDTDGDGIPDHLDECPDKAGLPEFNGCPDTDGDGIPDHLDQCPDQAGLPEFDGCPDRDGDGIPDHLDECPDVPGPAKFNGCPDTDGDGVPDHLDECPKTPGTIANKGCPEIKKEEKAILTQAFENLEFESGRAIIRRSSYASLDKLAALLVARPDWKVKLTGHTDNTGIAGNNMELSKNRAQSVKDYLISKGVKEYHIITEWFGQTRPIADNNTAEGRQKNRRVEMDIVFE